MQVLYRLSYVGSDLSSMSLSLSISVFSEHRPRACSSHVLERETGLEPATLSLEG
jgi:hypothetical protein